MSGKSSIMFLLLVFLSCRATLRSLVDITKIFNGDLHAKILHDIIFCGNFSDFKVSPLFSESYQMAIQSEDWILDNDDGLNKTAGADGNSIIIYFAPSTEENFSIVMDTIANFFAEVNMTSIKSNRRIFLVSWPHEMEDNGEDVNYASNASAMSRSLRTQFEEDPFFVDTVRSMRQNEEVYILVWKKTKGVRPSELNSSNQSQSQTMYDYSLLDIIELYGILDKVAVIQSLMLDFNRTSDDDVSMDDINTTELMRFSARRNNFRRVRFRVVAQKDESYNAEVEVEITNTSVNFLRGSSYSILKDFQHMLNFRYRAVAGEGWISESEDGKSLLGLGKQIMDRRADICISTSTLEVYRALFVQFLQPVLNEDSYMFFRQPSITAARNIFTMPFAWNLWYNIAGAWLVLMCCASFIVYQKQGNFRHVGTSRMFSKYKQEQENFHTADVFVWAIGVLCQQGWSTNPMKISTRVIFMTAMVTSVLLYAYYTAAFVATISAPIVPVKDISDLKKFQYQIIINPTSPAILVAFVGEAEGDRITKLSEKYFTNDSDIIKKVLNPTSKLAGIMGADGYFSVGLEFFNDTELCEVHQIKANGSARVKDAMIVRRGAPYKEIFGQKTIVLIERGFQNRYSKGYLRQTQLQCTHTTTFKMELEFLECYSAFVLLLLGYSIAVVSVLGERYCKRRQFRKQVLHMEMQIRSLIMQGY